MDRAWSPEDFWFLICDLRLGEKRQADAEDEAWDQVDGEREPPGYVLPVGRVAPECYSVSDPRGERSTDQPDSRLGSCDLVRMS